MSKVALITGVTGQDGSYLAEFLLEKGYEVHGIKRRASSFNTERVDHIYQDPHTCNPKFHLHYGDLSDTSNLTRILREVQPDEVYNLGAMSHVAVSFESPEYTADVDAMGTLRLLEAIRFLGLAKKSCTARLSSRFSSSRVRNTSSTSPRCSSCRLMAEPTIPRWPAIKMRCLLMLMTPARSPRRSREISAESVFSPLRGH